MSKGEQAQDYAGAAAPTLELILCEGDKRISAQVQLMLANDLRANGILAASATLAAAGFAVAGAQIGPTGNPHLLAAASLFAGFAALAALAALWALWPTGVDVQGWSPRLFVGDIAEKKTLGRIRAEMIAMNQTKIAANDRCNYRLAFRIRAAMVCLAVAPLFSGAALLLPWAWPGLFRLSRTALSL